MTPSANPLTIEVVTTFEGIHCWPDAPDQVAFLRYPHRHLFKVSLTLQVSSDDRELEFFIIKHGLDAYIRSSFQCYHPTMPNLFQLGPMSCEMLAKEFVSWAKHSLKVSYAACKVQEDEENSALFIGN